MPEAVSAVAAEEGFSDSVTLSVECGIFGGVPTWRTSVSVLHIIQIASSAMLTHLIYTMVVVSM